MDQPFDMRSNMKASPDSQGTLFRVADKGLLNPQQRWPKGYTPERQAEVYEASVPNRFQNQFRNPTGIDAGMYAKSINSTNDTIARSTVPTSDLKGLDVVASQPQGDAVAGGSHVSGRHVAGRYVSAFGVAEIAPGKEESGTVIHEIGHHVDYQRPGIHDRSSGQKEAFADDYAQTHFRDRSGQPEVMPEYPGRTQEFTDTYKAHRQTPMERQAGPGQQALRQPGEGQMTIHDELNRSAPSLLERLSNL